MAHGGRRPGTGRKTNHERLTAKEYLRRQGGRQESEVSGMEPEVSGMEPELSEREVQEAEPVRKVVDRDNPPSGDEPPKKGRGGRPKGARDKPRIVEGVSTKVLRDITEARQNTDAATAFALKIEEHRDALFEQAIKLALGGDKAMIQFLMEHQVGRAATKQAATPETTIIIRSLVPRPKGVGAADFEESKDAERGDAGPEGGAIVPELSKGVLSDQGGSGELLAEMHGRRRSPEDARSEEGSEQERE